MGDRCLMRLVEDPTKSLLALLEALLASHKKERKERTGVEEKSLPGYNQGGEG